MIEEKNIDKNKPGSAFESELLALLSKHRIPLAVIAYRRGADLCVRGVGHSKADKHHAKEITELFEKVAIEHRERQQP